METDTNVINNCALLRKMCRLCLKENSGSINIFNHNDQFSIPLRIMSCTSIEVKFSDKLPKMLCCDCRIQLEKLYFFKKRCQFADNNLRRYLHNIRTGKKSQLSVNIIEEYSDEFKDSLIFFNLTEKEQEKQINEQKYLETKPKDYIHIERSDRNYENAENLLNIKSSQRLINMKSTKPVNVGTQQKKLIIKESVYTDSSNQNNEKIFQFDYSDEEESIDPKYFSTKELENRNANENSELSIDELQQMANESPIQTIDLEYCTFEENDGVNEDDNITIDELTEEEHCQEEISECVSTYVNSTEKPPPAGIEEYNIENIKEIKNDKRIDENMTHVKIEDEVGKVFVMEIKRSQLEEKFDNVIEDNHEQNQNIKKSELKVFKCSLCPQAFTRKSLLIRHSTVHNKSRGYSCTYCQKWFACKSSRDRHTRVHTGEKPYKCEECNRSFIQKEILKRHMVTHTGVKPYRCPYCEKGFIQKQLLRQHINLKHEENPIVEMHKCYLCTKSFYHASGLSRHLLVHSGVSYTCDFCGKNFSDKSALKRHKTTVHSHFNET